MYLTVIVSLKAWCFCLCPLAGRRRSGICWASFLRSHHRISRQDNPGRARQDVGLSLVHIRGQFFLESVQQHDRDAACCSPSLPCTWRMPNGRSQDRSQSPKGLEKQSATSSTGPYPSSLNPHGKPPSRDSRSRIRAASSAKPCPLSLSYSKTSAKRPLKRDR
jgi:hypothetical protein